MNASRTMMLAACGLLLTTQAHADSPLLWQNNSLTYLYGKNFKVEPAIQRWHHWRSMRCILPVILRARFAPRRMSCARMVRRILITTSPIPLSMSDGLTAVCS